MLGNTHIALGLLAAAGAKEFLHLPVTPLEVILCTVGALIPDIDEPSSIIVRPGNFLFPYIPKWLRKTVNFITKCFSQLINKVFGHRSVTHWGIIPIVVLYFAVQLRSEKLFLFGLGYCSHLLGDLCTRQGIPVFAPLRFRNFSLFALKVGGNAEKMFAVGLWVFLLYYGVQLRFR